MKKYVVGLTDEERGVCEDTIAHLKGSSQKARRARILLQVDTNGPGWTDPSRRGLPLSGPDGRERAQTVRLGGFRSRALRQAAQCPSGSQAA